MGAFRRCFREVKSFEPGEGDRNGAAAKKLLRSYSVAQVVGMIEEAFRDDYFVNREANLWFVAKNPDRWRSAEAEPEKPAPPPPPPAPLTPEEAAELAAARARATAMVDALIAKQTPFVPLDVGENAYRGGPK